MEQEAGRIGRCILKPETVKGLAFDAVTVWRVFSLDRYGRDEPETPAAVAPTRERAGGDRHRRGGRAVAAGGRAQPAIPAGHPKLAERHNSIPTNFEIECKRSSMSTGGT